MLDALLPAGVGRFLAWKEKFGALGMSELSAARAATSQAHKRAYAQAKLEHLPKSVRSGLRCVVDVGANRGQWSSALLTLLKPARLELFEPNPEHAADLNACVQGLPHARVHMLALGDAPGELMLNVTQSSDFASFLEPSAAIREHYKRGATEIAKQVPVKVDTLDRALRELAIIDLLKLDVQGFERRVLAGGRSTLERTRALLVEANFVSHYANDESLGSLTELLR